MELIKLNNFINKTKIEKKFNGQNIFFQMKSAYNKNKATDGFTLDFDGIKLCSIFVFKEIISLMKKNLNGNYKLELINANQLIITAFTIAIKE